MKSEYQWEKNDHFSHTNAYFITFNALKPLPKLKIGSMIVNGDTYIPNSLWYYNCQKFGCHKSWCTKR